VPLRPLQVLLAAPRGFCAGVVRAIDAVEEARQLRDSAHVVQPFSMVC